MRLVVVEGNGPVRQRLASMVAEAGLTLAGEASDIAHACSLIKQEQPNAALIGQRLADGSGFDLIRTLGPLSPRHLVMLCEQIDPQYLITARRMGVDYLLEFPRDLELVPRLLRHLASTEWRMPATTMRA